jgi:hypothetical protein
LAAYAYYETKNPAFAKAAIAGLEREGGGSAAPRLITGPASLNPVEEDASVSTNEAAQTGLTTIEVLELCQDQLPTAAPPPRPARFGRGYGSRDSGPPPPARGQIPPGSTP